MVLGQVEVSQKGLEQALRRHREPVLRRREDMPERELALREIYLLAPL